MNTQALAKPEITIKKIEPFQVGKRWYYNHPSLTHGQRKQALRVGPFMSKESAEYRYLQTHQTMTTTDRLARIRARCVELLAIAEKRTPGKWIHDVVSGVNCDVRAASGRKVALCWGLTNGNPFRSEYKAECDANAAFIAACAGAAEAGWKATVATIDLILPRLDDGMPYCNDDRIADELLAAWEGLA